MQSVVGRTARFDAVITDVRLLYFLRLSRSWLHVIDAGGKGAPQKDLIGRFRFYRRKFIRTSAIHQQQASKS